MSIADTIKTARIKLGLSQTELASKVGVSKTAVGKWEKGKTAPNRGRAPVVARVLGLKPEEVQEHAQVGFTLLDDEDSGRMIPYMTMGDFLPVALNAGGIEISDYPTIPAEVEEKDDAIALRVDDSDMADEVNIGDIIIVSRRLSPRDDDLVVAHIGNTLVLRKYRSRGRDSSGHAVFDLLSVNPDVATITVNRKHPGKVVAVVIEHRKKRLPI